MGAKIVEMLRVVGGAAVFIVLFVAIALGAVGQCVIGSMPGYAVVLVDEKSKHYYSPPLIQSDKRDFLISFPLSECQTRGWKPATTEIAELVAADGSSEKIVFADVKRGKFFLLPQDRFVILEPVRSNDIRGKGYDPDTSHVNQGGFIDESNWVLQKLGLKPSRWTEDGDWRW